MSMANLLKVFLLFLLFFSGCAQKQARIIEINSVPFPFNINGTQPYVVWINGRRVDMPNKDVMILVSKIGKENIKTAKSKDIHRGWLYSYFKGDPSNELNTKKER